MKHWDNFRHEKLIYMAERCEKVLDFGQSARKDKQFFSPEQYSVADVDPTTNPDILTDICDMHMIEDDAYDGIICCAILEHVYNPFLAVSEMRRILRQGGNLFGYVPFLYGYHAKPGHYQDYFRFSEDGVRELFKDFEKIEICPVRGNMTTLLNMLPGRLNKLQNVFGFMDKYFSSRQVSGFNFILLR